MLRPRVIPCLLLKGAGLVKGVAFKDHRYVGDPINAVQIFNSKEVDEILFLDITATDENRVPSAEMIQRIADQCLVPFAVGGGIRSVSQIQAILAAGAEKVCLNTGAVECPGLVQEAAKAFGSQSVIVSIDVKKNFWGKQEAYVRCGQRKSGMSPVELARKLESEGAGEILVNSIDRDGSREGYDLNLIQSISEAVSIPVIAAGGAGHYEHLQQAIQIGKADAVAAGSLFVFHGRRQAVLISYPSSEEHDRIIQCK